MCLARQTLSCPQMTFPLSIAVFLNDKVHANGSNGLSRHRLFICWINSVFCPVGRKVDRYACLYVDTADATPRKRLKLFVSPSKALGGAADTNVEGFWDNPNVSLLKHQKQSILSWSSMEKDQRFNMDRDKNCSISGAPRQSCICLWHRNTAKTNLHCSYHSCVLKGHSFPDHKDCHRPALFFLKFVPFIIIQKALRTTCF